MKLCWLISKNCAKYYIYKVPSWIKPRDQVRDLISGRILTVGRIDQNNNFRPYDGIKFWASEFFERIEN